MKKAIFEGVGTALVTPFFNGSIDMETMKKLIDFQIEGGVSAIILCGTTGEASTLTKAEKEQIFSECTSYINGRVKVICGIGSNNPVSALEAAKQAETANADGVLMVTPYYNKTNQTGLIKHFEYVADRTSLPMIVYNVPGRTGIGINPETYKALSAHPNINGVKEASGNLSAAARSIALCGDELIFWSGNDADTVSMMALGAKGVISVASNIIPDALVFLCALCLSGRYHEAAAVNAKYAELFDELFIDVNPIPVKAVMQMLGLCSDELRLPLHPISKDKYTVLQKCINNLTRNNFCT